MKKIVFFDIDGTLLDHEKKLPTQTKAAINQLRKNDVYVAIATGRAPFMFKHIREELEIDSYISFNGQFVVFEQETIYKNPLNEGEIEKLITHSNSNGHPLVFLNEHTMKANVVHHPYIEESLASIEFPHPDKEEEFYRNREIYQSLVFFEEKDEGHYLNRYPHFDFVRWHPYSVDVLPAGGSKAEGIKKMIHRLGFALEDVYAFGDGLNDIQMLSAVGTGVAMGNASEFVKQHADMVTTDVADQGIYNGLKKLGLI
ncbi:Cof-type HAD-IIB family hydrolase [Cytobacillus spongiae]|jgi:Cof subfamily protein (haloacid dehalogenase superfamily)|uniref:Cof-type HAD-IIB family hydrolase n=1 Tax=Cytobacillus spongiae TaxID=2901381 RepID=UPI001F362042|nr:Cof-type HAD-IIB family hydrolase [Cytobacillus spongiae]UII57241.1 Cof-type HAD-IIB family hydrolase [Cytobacillus spongiae]